MLKLALARPLGDHASVRAPAKIASCDFPSTYAALFAYNFHCSCGGISDLNIMVFKPPFQNSLKDHCFTLSPTDTEIRLENINNKEDTGNLSPCPFISVPDAVLLHP